MQKWLQKLKLVTFLLTTCTSVSHQYSSWTQATLSHIYYTSLRYWGKGLTAGTEACSTWLHGMLTYCWDKRNRIDTKTWMLKTLTRTLYQPLSLHVTTAVCLNTYRWNWPQLQFQELGGLQLPPLSLHLVAACWWRLPPCDLGLALEENEQNNYFEKLFYLSIWVIVLCSVTFYTCIRTQGNSNFLLECQCQTGQP